MDQKQNNPKTSGAGRGNRDVAFLCGSLLLSVAFLYFFLSPLYQKKLASEKTYAARQEDLKGKQELLANIETFNRENKDLTVNSKKLVLLIPNRNNFEDFFIHLQQLSRNFNLELSSFALEDVKNSTVSNTPGTTTSTGAVITPEGGEAASASAAKTNQQGIALSMRGDFASVLGFTKALENGIPFLQENKISLTSGTPANTQPGQSNQSSDQNPLLDVKLDLRFIYY